MLESEGSLSVVEWSENIPRILRPGTALIEIAMEKGGARTFKLSGAWLEAALEGVAD